jgi:pyruvate,water dikinase
LEDDDVLYARLQAHVRRALLREGQRLQTSGLLADPEDVFWLPLDAVRADARGDAPLTATGVARAIVEAFRADEAARASPPPLELSGREPVTAPPYAGEVVRGISGSGGARIGRVRLHGDPSNPPGPTEVLVARTLLPTELPLVAPIAIVVETGGALDHVAAQARERGIPAIVGAAGATQMLRDGDEVLVDADAGLVVRLAPRSV